MRELKAYTYEGCDSYISSAVNAALTNPKHIRQGRIIVWARTAKQAFTILAEFSLTCGSKLPRIAHGDDVDALTRAGWGRENRVFVISNYLETVVLMSPAGPRLIGKLVRGPQYTKVFERVE